MTVTKLHTQCSSTNLLSLGPGSKAPWQEQDLGLEFLVPPFTSNLLPDTLTGG